jgi:hypothetical protein
VDRRITAFEQDAEGHWVARLECGHPQHMRHRPPLERRHWVVTEEGRASRIGVLVNCVRCDREREAE